MKMLKSDMPVSLYRQAVALTAKGSIDLDGQHDLGDMSLTTSPRLTPIQLIGLLPPNLSGHWRIVSYVTNTSRLAIVPLHRES